MDSSRAQEYPGRMELLTGTFLSRVQVEADAEENLFFSFFSSFMQKKQDLFLKKEMGMPLLDVVQLQGNMCERTRLPWRPATPVRNCVNIISAQGTVSDIKLIRTDNTLDLSQKAEKVCLWKLCCQGPQKQSRSRRGAFFFLMEGNGSTRNRCYRDLSPGSGG